MARQIRIYAICRVCLVWNALGLEDSNRRHFGDLQGGRWTITLKNTEDTGRKCIYKIFSYCYNKLEIERKG